jgi:antitoxin component YwqK of YwqJK toxin-antitoxin module
MKKILFTFTLSLFAWVVMGQTEIKKEYYDSGKLKKETSYTDGLKNGIEKIYNEDGSLLEENQYLNDKLVGVSKEYFKNGNTKIELHHIGEGGLYKEYSENGTLMLEAEWKEDIQNRLVKQYNANGKIKKIIPYIGGKINGNVNEYYTNGILRCSYKYVDGTIEIRELEQFEENGKFGFKVKSPSGIENVLVEAKYDHCNNFKDGFAAVSINDKWGFIDITGKEITLLKYDQVLDFNAGIAYVYINENLGAIDQSGKEILELKYQVFRGNPSSNGTIVVGLNDKIGIVELVTNREVIPFIYDDANNFINGIASVKLNDKWGFVDEAGKVIISIQYEKVGMFFSEGIIDVKSNGKWGCVDSATNVIIVDFKYDAIADFSEGLTAVNVGCVIENYYTGCVGGKWGYIDKTGKEIIPIIYDKAYSFSDGKAEVTLNGRTFYIDENGNEIK